MAAAAGATAVYNAAAQQQSVDVDDKGAASGQRQMAKQGSMEALRAHWGHGAATTKASFEQFLAGQPQPVSLGQEAAGLRCVDRQGDGLGTCVLTCALLGGNVG